SWRSWFPGPAQGPSRNDDLPLNPLRFSPLFHRRFSAFPRGRRRHGAAWRPRHLTKAAEVDLRHRHAEPAGDGVREFVIALETAPQPAAPRRDAAAGVQFEGGFAAVERRRDVV